MNKSICIGLTLGAVVLGAWAAPDLSKLPPAVDKKDVTYAQDIQPIFKQYCFGCHTGDRARDGLRLETLEAVLKGGSDGPVVVTNKPLESKLLIAVARLDPRGVMPPAPRRPPTAPGSTNAVPQAKGLTTDEIALVRAWIEQGAK